MYSLSYVSTGPCWSRGLISSLFLFWREHCRADVVRSLASHLEARTVQLPPLTTLGSSRGEKERRRSGSDGSGPGTHGPACGALLLNTHNSHNTSTGKTALWPWGSGRKTGQLCHPVWACMERTLRKPQDSFLYGPIWVAVASLPVTALAALCSFCLLIENY